METKRNRLHPIAYLSIGFILGLLVLITGSKVLSADTAGVAPCDNNWVLESGGDGQSSSYIYQPCTGQVFLLHGGKATLVAFPK